MNATEAIDIRQNGLSLRALNDCQNTRPLVAGCVKTQQMHSAIACGPTQFKKIGNEFMP